MNIIFLLGWYLVFKYWYWKTLKISSLNYTRIYLEKTITELVQDHAKSVRLGEIRKREPCVLKTVSVPQFTKHWSRRYCCIEPH